MENFLENITVTEIVLVCFVSKGTGNAIHNNRPSHGLALNLGGKKSYVFKNGNSFSVEKNELIYLPKGSYYKVFSEIPGDTYCINFQIAKDETFSPFHSPIKNIDKMLNAYREAEKAWSRKKMGYEYKCKSELYKVIYEAYKEQNIPYSDNKKAEIIKPAVEYIHKYYAEEIINMQNLSDLCSISYEYLRKLFHTFYGCSPTDYVNNLRIRRAKELLNSGFYSVAKVAELSGFFDDAYFSRFFKKQIGISPFEYKKGEK